MDTKHSVLTRKTHWVGNRSEPSCEARKTLLWSSLYMEAKAGQSLGSNLELNWREKPGNQIVRGFPMRSEVTVLIFN